MKIVWQHHRIDDVMDYFTKAFEVPEDQEILRHEWFYDPHKGVVVFKLVVTEASDG